MGFGADGVFRAMGGSRRAVARLVIMSRSRTAHPMITAVALAAGGLLGAVGWIRRAAHGHRYGPESVPPAPAVLVLGAKVHPDGRPSEFLKARLELARRVYQAGKAERILVSGDGVRPDYDEPGAMVDHLVAAGVPADKIIVDRAGLDTYDSCLRAQRLFGLTELIIVTQTYHLSRAVGIARLLGLTAYGVGDATVRRFRRPWVVGTIREQAAYLKAVADLARRRPPAHPTDP